MDTVLNYIQAVIGELTKGNVGVWITLIVAAIVIIFVLHFLWELIQKWVTGIRILSSEPKEYKTGACERVPPVLNTLDKKDDAKDNEHMGLRLVTSIIPDITYKYMYGQNTVFISLPVDGGR